MENYKQKIAELMKADKYAEAFMYCGKALRENPNDLDVQKTAAFIFQRIQDAHIEIEANTAEEYTMRGIAFLYSNQIEFAIYDFDMAIGQDENYDYALKSRSFLRMVTGQLNLAESDIKQAIKINPTSEYYNDYGNIKSQQNKNNPESLDYYLKAVQLNPEVELFWYNYGIDLAEKGKLKEAVIAFDEALRLNPNYEDAQVNRAFVLSHLNNK